MLFLHGVMNSGFGHDLDIIKGGNWSEVDKYFSHPPQVTDPVKFFTVVICNNLQCLSQIQKARLKVANSN